jgi:hypothetical protein
MNSRRDSCSSEVLMSCLPDAGGLLDGGLDACVGAAAADVPDIADSISASVGFFFEASSAAACMICPDWQ